MTRSLYADDAPDDATLAKAATEALTRPGDSAWFDDRLFHSHGCVWTWADRSDDILAESNYQTALDALVAVAGQTEHAGDCCWDESGQKRQDPHEDDVLDISASHWAVGSVRHIFVRVRYDDGTFTPAFVEAVKLGTFVREQYPILDESDYCERESEAFDKDLDNALDHVKRQHEDDTDADEEAITARFHAQLSEGKFEAYGSDGCGSASWDTVETEYDRIRDEFFGGRAQELFVPYLASDVPAVHPDQSTLL